MSSNASIPYRGKRWTLAAICLATSTMLSAAEYPAALDWSGRVALTLPASGVLENVIAQAGQRVAKGELLANLDAVLFKTGVAEARADMDRLTEEHAEATRDLERVQELYARTVASTTELDAARLRHARVNSGLAAVQARVERARRLLADAELRAPFDAVILQRHAEPGQVIASQFQPAAVFTVARADELIARAEISASQAIALRLGESAEVLLGDAGVQGKVRAISCDAMNRYTLEVALPRPANWAPGQSVRVQLP